jgi:hypothetical protein
MKFFLFYKRSNEADRRNLEFKLHEAQMEREKAEIEGTHLQLEEEQNFRSPE